MSKMRLVQKKKIKTFQKKYKKEEFDKIKKEGIILQTKNSDLIVNIKEEIFEKNYKKPLISLFDINNISTGIVFSLPEFADEAFVDFKLIERYPTHWNEYGRIKSPQKDRIYTFENNISFGKQCIYRITYFKDNAIRYSDAKTSDINYSFFQDVPEIAVLNKESPEINVFNLSRFVGAGYIKVFREENEEIRECIFHQKINSSILSFYDNNSKNLNLYKYYAEIYDNLGNMYLTDIVKIDIRNSLERKIKKINIDKKGQFIEIDKENKIEITIYDIEKEAAYPTIYNIENEEISTESADPNCVCEIDKNKLYFNIEKNIKEKIVFVEGFENDKSISYCYMIEKEKDDPKINNVSIKTNKKFQNVIQWGYDGNIDSFVVFARDSKKIRLIEKLSHRMIDGEYIYCIDGQYAAEPVKTEYIINGIDEFGKIIAKARIVKDGYW